MENGYSDLRSGNDAGAEQMHAEPGVAGHSLDLLERLAQARHLQLLGGVELMGEESNATAEKPG